MNMCSRGVIGALILLTINASGAAPAGAAQADGGPPNDRGRGTFISGETDPPTVMSIVPVTPSPTNLAEVEFLATFSEPVVGVDITDFVLDSHNLVGEYISGVSGDWLVYTITVHSGNGEGVMDVALTDDDSIMDLASNPLGGAGVGNGNYNGSAILVIDRRGPQIEISASNPVSIECGSGAFPNPAATAIDALDGDVTQNIQVTGTVDPDATGSYALTYAVDDALGNHSEVVLVVNVEDTSVPELFVTGDDPLDWPCDTPYADPGATVADQCDGAPQLVIDTGAVNVSQAGTYTVHFTARDGSGNEQYAQRAVVISDPCGAHDGVHSADQDADGHVGLSELLRVIQFFNSGGLHCAEPPDTTEDGYVPGVDAVLQGCPAHHSDYDPHNWAISLSELLRIIQFFNSGGYHYCPGDGTEDGFCPGV